MADFTTYFPSLASLLLCCCCCEYARTTYVNYSCKHWTALIKELDIDTWTDWRGFWNVFHTRAFIHVLNRPGETVSLSIVGFEECLHQMSCMKHSNRWQGNWLEFHIFEYKFKLRIIYHSKRGFIETKRKLTPISRKNYKIRPKTSQQSSFIFIFFFSPDCQYQESFLDLTSENSACVFA